MTNIEAVLERIEAFPNSLQDEELYFYDESDTDITPNRKRLLNWIARERDDMRCHAFFVVGDADGYIGLAARVLGVAVGKCFRGMEPYKGENE